MPPPALLAGLLRGLLLLFSPRQDFALSLNSSRTSTKSLPSNFRHAPQHVLLLIC